MCDLCRWLLSRWLKCETREEFEIEWAFGIRTQLKIGVNYACVRAYLYKWRKGQNRNSVIKQKNMYGTAFLNAKQSKRKRATTRKEKNEREREREREKHNRKENMYIRRKTLVLVIKLYELISIMKYALWVNVQTKHERTKKKCVNNARRNNLKKSAAIFIKLLYHKKKFLSFFFPSPVNFVHIVIVWTQVPLK